MGSVWRAEHLGWEAPVAIKLMNRDVAELPEARARFEREVRLAAELRGPHVVQVLDHGVDEGTRTPFIAMELLDGESLEGRLRRQGPLSPADTFEIISQLVRALSRAHEAGVVHRDLKPDNIFLVRNDEQSVVKILDFGIARGSRANLASRLTRPGRVLGTPFYMSPEQFRGVREIDHRADLWSLAAISCECLTGRRPFEARDLGELALLLLRNSGRPLPSTLGPVPAGFDAWFLRGTHPDIEQRFQTARELGTALGSVCGAGSRQPALGPTEELPAVSSDGSRPLWRLRSGMRVRWSPARVAGVCLLATVPLAAGAVWQYQRQQAAARERAALALVGTPEVATPALQPALQPAVQPAVPSAVPSAVPPAPVPPTAAAVPREPTVQQPSATQSGVQQSTVQQRTVQQGAPASDPTASSAQGAPSAAPAPLAAWPAPGDAATAPRTEARAQRRKEHPARERKSARRERAATAAGPDAPTVDVNGKPIRMTLELGP